MKAFLTKLLSVVLLATVTTAGLMQIPALGKKVSADYRTPRLIVTGSETDVDKVIAGDEFDLTVHFMNESSDTDLKNIKLSFNSADNEIYPTDGTNVYYVDSVKRDETFDITVRFATRADLDPKPYSLTVTYDYEDKNKISYQDSSEIVIPIFQTTALTVSDLRLAKNEVILNSKTSFSMKINNTGKTTAYNVCVSINGDMIDDVETVVGNIDTGSNSTVDISLKGVATGTGNVNVTVYYEDYDGNKYEVAETLELTVSEPLPMELNQDAVPTINMTYVIIAVVAVIVVIIVVSIIVRKKREKKYA